MRRGIFCSSFLFVVLSLALPACAPSLRVETGMAMVREQARAELRQISGATFELWVENLSSEPMVIYRDDILLQSAAGTRAREEGGAADVYRLEPGDGRQVNVRFDLSGIRAGEVVRILFQSALRVGGRPVSLPPIVLRAI